jgi:hypothetical protein
VERGFLDIYRRLAQLPAILGFQLPVNVLHGYQQADSGDDSTGEKE